MTAEKEALETTSQCVAADASGPVIVTELPMPGLPDFWSIRLNDQSCAVVNFSMFAPDVG